MEQDNKKKFIVTGISCAVIFTTLYFITNISAIATFFSSVLAVLAPIIVGAAIAYILNPLLKLFEYKVFKKMRKKRLRRGLSLLLTYVTSILLLVAFFWLMIPRLMHSVLELTSRFGEYVDQTVSFVNSLISKFSENTSHQIDEATLIDAVQKFLFASGDAMATIAEYLKEFGMGLFVGVKNFILGFFISIYILISKESLHAQIRRLSAAVFKDKTRNLMFKYVRIINKTFGSFFIGKIVDSAIIGLITLVTLAIFKMPHTILVSTIVGITNVIPVFGPFIGAIPSAFIIFIADPKKALIFLILILIIQQLDGNIIGPKILGNSTGISSLGVIIAIIIMGEYFGLIGMIVGVPIFATIIIIINELIETKLKKKNRSAAIEDYYPAYSLVDPHEHHEKVSEKAFHSLWERIVKIFNKQKSNKVEKNPTESEESKEETQEKESTNKNERTDEQ